MRSGAVLGHAAENDEGLRFKIGVWHVEPVHMVPLTGHPEANDAQIGPSQGLPVARVDLVVTEPKIVEVE
jgi:hypothetical protein